MATIKDIAHELGIGVSTVSMALNDHPSINIKTKEKVHNTALAMGYVKNGTAVDLRRKRTNLILLIVDDASRPFFSRVIDAAQRTVASYGYDLLIATTFHGSTQTAERYISEYRADAAIVFTPRIQDEFLTRYASKKFPIFVLTKEIKTENRYCISFPKLSGRLNGEDNPMEYLIAKGHRKICFIKGKDNYGTRRRFKNYKETLEKYAIEYNDHYVFEAKNSTPDDGYQVTKSAMKLIGHEIDSILYTNDDLAIGGLQLLHEQKIEVPTQISVMGQTNLVYSELSTPKLTSLSAAEYYSTSYAVDVLMKVLDGELLTEDEMLVYTEKILIERKIIERETVRKRE